jgi:hypothetical protein
MKPSPENRVVAVVTAVAVAVAVVAETAIKPQQSIGIRKAAFGRPSFCDENRSPLVQAVRIGWPLEVR